MKKSNDMTKNLNRSSLSFQEREGGTDGWMRWLRSTLTNREHSPLIRPVNQGADLTKEPTGQKSIPVDNGTAKGAGWMTDVKGEEQSHASSAHHSGGLQLP